MCVSRKFRSKKGVGGSGGGSYDTRRHPPKSAPAMRKVFLEKAVLEPVYKFDKKSYRECLKRGEYFFTPSHEAAPT